MRRTDNKSSQRVETAEVRLSPGILSIPPFVRLPIVHTSIPLKYLTRIKTDPSTDCWIWKGVKVVNPRYRDRRKGYEYGIIDLYFGRENGRARRACITAHRFFYEAVNGQVAKHLDLHHKCENKLCVNPEHLEPLTTSEHMQEHFRNGGVK